MRVFDEMRTKWIDKSIYYSIYVYICSLGLFYFSQFFVRFFVHQSEFPSFLEEIRNCFSKRNTK